MGVGRHCGGTTMWFAHLEYEEAKVVPERVASTGEALGLKLLEVLELSINRHHEFVGWRN